SQEIATRIEEMYRVPTMLSSTAHIRALNKLSAKRIIVVSPYAEEINEKVKVHYQDAGFDVLNIKGLGLTRNVDFGKLPDDASYRLAREAFLEAPGADAIVIECSTWPVVRNIEPLEKDFGKPVVTAVTGDLWAALATLHYKTPIKGYGELLEKML
ncbi:MAG: maleate cis-trans isomerase, partial [Chloroflexi bacterium]|nr:maleate cis-trans isomerase [Chloroflexota bacterium]